MGSSGLRRVALAVLVLMVLAAALGLAPSAWGASGGDGIPDAPASPQALRPAAA